MVNELLTMSVKESAMGISVMLEFTKNVKTLTPLNEPKKIFTYFGMRFMERECVPNAE